MVAGCGDGGDDVQVEVVAEGLLNPIGLAFAPDGSLLVAEEGTGADDTSAGVSLIAGRRVERVVSGLPSGRDSGDLSGVPLIGVSPDGELAYTAHFGSAALLGFRPLGAAGGDPLGPDDLTTTLTPLNRVQLVNAFDIAFAPDGTPVVTDASGNGVATANPDGTVRFIHRFDSLRAPGTESLRIDPVPTGIARVGDEYYVTLTGGCPYPAGAGRLVAIDGERGERVVADGLDMPIDVAQGPDGTIWVLEFARFDEGASCFTGRGYRPGTGRLGRLLPNGRVDVVVDGLDFPGAVLPAPDGSVYVSEVFGGRVLRVLFGADQPQSGAAPGRPWRFTDVAEAVGIDFWHGAFATGVDPSDRVAAMGGGVCWIDYDGDGRLDLYLVNSHSAGETAYWEGRGGLPPNALYRNLGDSFEPVVGAAGGDLATRGNGCVAFDYDGDGDTDLYVTADGPNTLLRNDGGAFEDVTAAAGVTAPEWSSAAAAGDVDGDGTLDLFVASYIDLTRTIAKPSGAFPQDYLGVRDHLFLNEGDGTFRDATLSVGLEREDRGLGAVLTDVDGDGRLDLYVANDGEPNRLYRATGEGPEFRFVDVTTAAAVGDSGSGMGVAGGDYDGDGSLDLFVTNWERELHALYRNLGPGSAEPHFQYSTFRIGFAGLGDGDTGWGTAFADFDHDTDLDLLVVNGRVPVTNPAADAEPVRLFGNLSAEGRAGEFREWTATVGLDDAGRLLGRGSAVADYDDDGDLDVAVNQIAGPAVLLRNDGAPGNWLEVALDPLVPGALVRVVLPDGRELVREARAGGSYLSSEDPRLHFGLAGDGEVEVVVTRPGATPVRLADVTANQLVTVELED